MKSISKAILAVVMLLGLASSQVLAAYCHGKPSPDAQSNLLPIYEETPVFVRQVKNAKLYTVGPVGDEVSIVHLWGTPYEQGYAHGELMKDSLSAFMNNVWSYLELQVEEAISGKETWIPKDVVDWLSNVGLDDALDLTLIATEKYTGTYFFDEIQGMSDASGVDKKLIERIHMIGELTKGSCSMYGAWGSAVQFTNSKLMQLRALDWDTDGPFKDFPQITVYHPINETMGYPFANIGWTGWIGSITGFSAQQMAICEIGVSFPDSTFGQESRFGIPFTFILRDILQFDQTLDNSITRIATAHRTCDLILGVGDGKLGEMRSFQYSASVAGVMDDENLRPVADWHPRIENIVYHGMDWDCPSYNQILGQYLQQYHGNITAENTIREITSHVQTGNLHVAIYDLTNMVLHLANARRSDVTTGAQYAFDRTFLKLDMNSLFTEPAPASAPAIASGHAHHGHAAHHRSVNH